MQRDADSGAAHFTHGSNGPQTVCCNDAETVRTCLAFLLLRHPDLAGVSLRRLDGEDPGVWPVLRAALLKD